MSELTKKLASISCADVLDHSSPFYQQIHVNSKNPSGPIHIDTKLSIKDACNVLSVNHISSAPIYDSDKKEFVGLLEYFDLVSHVLQVLAEVPMQESLGWTLGELLEKVSATAHPLSSLETKRPLVWVENQSSLLSVLQKMVDTNTHRVAVMDNVHFLGVVSQSLIASIVVAQHGIRGDRCKSWPFGKTSLKELGIIVKDIVSVTESDTVMDALYRMHLNNISSIAIMSKNNLVGSISMTDIKEILGNSHGWRKLFQSAASFFKDIRMQQSLDNDGKAILPIFAVEESTSLITALEKMSATRTHRIWVFKSGSEEVIGLVSLSSIMPLFLK